MIAIILVMFYMAYQLTEAVYELKRIADILLVEQLNRQKNWK